MTASDSNAKEWTQVVLSTSESTIGLKQQVRTNYKTYVLHKVWHIV